MVLMDFDLTRVPPRGRHTSTDDHRNGMYQRAFEVMDDLGLVEPLATPPAQSVARQVALTYPTQEST